MADKARCIREVVQTQMFNDEHIPTDTSIDQVETEENVKDKFWPYSRGNNIEPMLQRQKHIQFLKSSLFHLPAGYETLDASRPWLCFWTLNSLYLLDYTFSDELISQVTDFLGRCQNEDGGFGGGPGQISHLAPTYAAICALCTLGSETAYNVINRESLAAFLARVRDPMTGAFALHEGGEEDIRGVYCAVAVAVLTNTYSDELFSNTAEWVAGCQSYEGGFSGVPGMEAHGGYSFCGLAALVLLNKRHLMDVQALLRWCVNRQMAFEGGFQGRTNKLVDGCYSYWQGGAFPIIHEVLARAGDSDVPNDGRWLFHQEALQEYILLCCQSSRGGLIDKPTKERDLYHTCYNLSGLSVAQSSSNEVVLGPHSNKVNPINVLFNVGLSQVNQAIRHFSVLPVPKP